MSAQYRFQASDFEASGSVDAARLREEVEADGSIGVGVEDVSVDAFPESPSEFVCAVSFVDPLDEVGETALRALVAAHSGLPLAPLAICSLVPPCDRGRDVRSIDFDTGLTTRLREVLSVVYRGEVREIRRYLDDTCATLAIVESMAYVRTPLGLAVERTTVRTWYRTDGTPHPRTKVTLKVYDPLAQMQEGRRRRENVVDNVSMFVLVAIAITEYGYDPWNPDPAKLALAEADGMAYIAKYESALGNYVRTGDLSFRTPPASPNITDDAEPWLDNDMTPLGQPGVSIRAWLLDAFQPIVG